MSILQERLPCASFYFRQRRAFKHNLAMEQAERAEYNMNVDQQASPNQNFDVTSRESY